MNKPTSLSGIKKELYNLTPEELITVCLNLAKHKKETKEYLSYLLFDASDKDLYLKNVKTEIDEMFNELKKSNLYQVKKSLRKILRVTNKYIKFAGSKQVEAELLIHFCKSFKRIKTPANQSIAMTNLYLSQVQKIKKAIGSLHEDLQFDYQDIIDNL
jgi:hypothetical protein